MLDVLRSPYPVQAVRPMHHWWLCPRVLAWLRVLMIMSLAKPPASAGPLSRIGDYLFAARGPGLFLGIRRRTTFPYESTVTRGPPYPLFHRRRRGRLFSSVLVGRDRPILQDSTDSPVLSIDFENVGDVRLPVFEL